MVISQLAVGEKAKITNISRGQEARRRLVDLGLIPGTEVEMIAVHPWGGPLLLKVGRSHVALGRNVASAIQIEKKENCKNDKL